MKAIFLWMVWGLTAAMAVEPLFAADKQGKDQSQAQFRRLQQQLRAAEQEKSQLSQQLAQQKAEAEGQIKDVQAKMADAQRRASVASGRASLLTKELESIKAKYESLRAEKEALASSGKVELAALTSKLADAERRRSEQQRTYEAEKQLAEDAMMKTKAAMTVCVERNSRMYRLGNELLEKYEKKSCMTSMFQAEPFTGIKRAQVERLVEEYREKLDKDQMLPVHGNGVIAPAR